MDMFIGLTGFVVMIIGFILLLINAVRKKPKKKAGIVMAAGFAFLIIGLSMPSSATEESANADEEAPAVEEIDSEENAEPEEEVVAEKTQEEKDAEEAAKKKAEEEKVAAEKAETEKKLAAEKEFYVNEIQTKVDTQMGMFDEAWSTFWVPTFEGISDGTVDVYQAYENMKSLEQRYETLRSSLPAIETESLSKENKEQFDIFVDKMRSASWWRMEGTKKAQVMFDEGDFRPSRMDEITSDISIGDSEMIEAITALTILEDNLGIERE